MKVWRVWGVVVAAVVLVVASLGSTGARAAGDEPEGYCTADDKAVVTYWPPGWEGNYRPSCYQGLLAFTDVHPAPIGQNPIQLTDRETPDDFGRWVFLWFNDSRITNPYRDVYPYVAKSTGRTLVPLRYVSEALGAQVSWDGYTRTITITWRGQQVLTTIGSPKAFVDGKEIALDQPPLIWKDRTMVPLRFIAEAFGAQVEWEESGSAVIINMSGVECAPAYCAQQ